MRCSSSRRRPDACSRRPGSPSKAKITITTTAPRSHGGKDPKEGTKADVTGSPKEGHSDDAHSSFRAEYAFECKAPASLTSIAFGYFKVFAGAQKLDVTVVTPKQQSKFEVTRANPRIDLGGMM